MNDTEKILLIAGGLLLIVATVLFVRICQYKSQIRNFTKRVKERKTDENNQPVTVDFFDDNVLALADALNEYTDMIKSKTYSLEQERRQLKTVIAGISHDFRTPLTAAKGYMQMIDKSNILDEKNKEYLDVAMSKIEYLKSLSDAFFEVSAIEANDEQVQLSDVHLTNLLLEQVTGQYDWINERGLETSFAIPETDIVVSSNEGLLERIFENIFSNAKKYTESSLKLALESYEKKVVISVKNGIPHLDEVDVERVFDAFYREPSRHSLGTGLGLYVVKCLADRLGHRVWAESDGDTFAIFIEFDEVDYERF